MLPNGLLFCLLLPMVASSEDLLAELRALKTSAPPSPERLSKRAIREHYSDLHCLQKFEVSPSTIIRTAESQKNGAVFINVTNAESFELCLSGCCDTQLCNVAVFDEQGGSCFMFDCGAPVRGEFACRFTTNDLFTSGALEVNRHDFEDSQYQARESHASELSGLLNSVTADFPSAAVGPSSSNGGGGINLSQQTVGPAAGTGPARPPSCGIWQFTCGSGDCIAGYDVCDGIPQCDDSSDEAPETCPTSTPKPTTRPIKKPGSDSYKTTTRQPIINRPDDVSKWGREGEKSSPKDLVQTSNFQHRGSSGVQVPNAMMPLPNSDPRLYGFQQPPYGGYNQQNGYGYGYPPQPPPNYQPGYNNYYGPQQQPILPPQQPPQQSTQAQPVVVSKAGNSNTVVASNATTKVPRLLSAQNAGNSQHGELAPSDPDLDMETQKYLLKDLKPSDFVMETPVAAYFTLILGSTIGLCVCFLICCRLKNQQKRGRKRNLASDSGDGDYLVNGLYL